MTNSAASIDNLGNVENELHLLEMAAGGPRAPEIGGSISELMQQDRELITLDVGAAVAHANKTCNRPRTVEPEASQAAVDAAVAMLLFRLRQRTPLA